MVVRPQIDFVLRHELALRPRNRSLAKIWGIGSIGSSFSFILYIHEYCNIPNIHTDARGDQSLLYLISLDLNDVVSMTPLEYRVTLIPSVLSLSLA